MLGEVYGQMPAEESHQVAAALEKGLKFTYQLWDIRKGKFAEDEGGFRYVRPYVDPGGAREGDLSNTGWHAASLRSMANAGFRVPQSVMKRISGFVRRCHDKTTGGFSYRTREGDPASSAMTGAGALCLALAAEHDAPALPEAARYLCRVNYRSRQTFKDGSGRTWPYYTCYYHSQAATQLGGQVWAHIMPQITDYLLAKQTSSGLWPLDGSVDDCGQSYSTAMAILSLTPQLHLLPIYQR
jgi:hypothetical protein